MFVQVKDENLKIKLRNLGFGFEEDGKYYLNELEYFFLVEEGIIKDNPREVEERLNKWRKDWKKYYRVYKLLRKKGYVLRYGETLPYFRVYRKGVRYGEDRTIYLMKVVDRIRNDEVFGDLALAGEMRKELVYAVLGEKIRFIKIQWIVFE